MEVDSGFVYRGERLYFFTSALGDALEEDRDKRNPCTPQLVAHGLMDVHFMVENEKEVEEKAPGEQKSYHYFHMPDVVLVTEFFSPGSEPSIITPAEKKRMDEKERDGKKEKTEVVEGGEKDEGNGEILEGKEGEINGNGEEKGKGKETNGEPEKREVDPDREGFELCLGQDFFQMYPHLMFSIVATPALEQRISPIHFGQSTTQLTYEGEALSICAVGTCVGRDVGGKLTLENGFAVHFAPQSVYNTYYCLPKLRQQRMKAPKEVDPKLTLVAPTLVRACLASLILAFELAISLRRLNLSHKFNGVVIYHNTDYFDEKRRKERAYYQARGIPYPNMDLIYRLNHLRGIANDRKRGNLGRVRLVRGDEKQLEAAMSLATLGTYMVPFKAGPGSFEESRMAVGTEHPVNIGEWGIDSDDPGLDPEKYFISVERPKENLQDDSLEAPGPTLERSEDGTFSIPESMIVKRSPMFLNFGNSTTYVVRGKPIAYTERQLFVIDRDIDIAASTLSVRTNVLSR